MTPRKLVARGRREQPSLPAENEPPLVEMRLFSGVAPVAMGDTLVTLWSMPATPPRWSWTCCSSYGKIYEGHALP